jgi:arabinan endo-1,5-alpha-L-arabinosidase
MRCFAPKLLSAALLIAAPLVGTGSPAAPARQAPSYANPVIDSDFPDPAIIRASDGRYYVYATQGAGPDGKMLNIQVATSGDLTSWRRLGDALPVKPAWASRTQDFWAPHITEHRGTYYLYYSAKPDEALADQRKGLCLAVATARRPDGPFTDIGKPLQCGPGFVNIDPMAYDDPASGRPLLYWGSGFEPIKVRELAQDRISFAPGSAPVDLVKPVKGGDYQQLVEGAWVIRRGRYFYLFYSGDNCCGPKAHYAVMVARSRSATGPFETLASVTGARSSVILERDGRWIAPGHNSIISDALGTDWMLYHAVDGRRPRAKPGDEVNTRRVMLIDRIVWRNGWPRIEGDAPSSSARPRPATNRMAAAFDPAID